MQGLHHITAIASNPQQNVAFYQNVLGQRLVKQTVNFDDPGTYHLYYGDEIGTPGTILTFFPWPHIVRGSAGTGEATTVAYRIPADSFEFWKDRFDALNVPTGATTRFGERVLTLQDPDGMHVELIATGSARTVRVWNGGDVPAEHALQGFHSVTATLETVEPTAAVLTEHLGYEAEEREDDRFRYGNTSDAPGRYVDILLRPRQAGRFGAGSIHHIAFRAADAPGQAEYLTLLRDAGHQVTSVKDRQYFHSIYFREPGGVLFEIATDGPGFDVDEPVETLGAHLKLPPWLEARREHIESVLPPLT